MGFEGFMDRVFTLVILEDDGDFGLEEGFCWGLVCGRVWCRGKMKEVFLVDDLVYCGFLKIRV